MKKPCVLILAQIAFVFALPSLQGGSATWNLNPINGIWTTPSNWTPAIVPNGPADIATFGQSNTTAITASAITLDRMVFEAGASAYTFSGRMTISGEGVDNFSGVTQEMVSTPHSSQTGYLAWSFANSATAGSNVHYTARAGATSSDDGGYFEFLDNSTAGSGSFTVEGGIAASIIYFREASSAGNATFTTLPGLVTGGIVSFDQNPTSTAANATFINDGGTASGQLGGRTSVTDAANATFINHGASAARAFGGTTSFSTVSGSATFIAEGGTNGGGGGQVSIGGSADTSRSHFQVLGNAILAVGNSTLPPPIIGSLAGDGFVYVYTAVAIGDDDDSSFAGMIQTDPNQNMPGAVTKVGSGSLTLTGANTYPDGTTIDQGALVVANTSGSATGPGPVVNRSGVLAGTGTMAGPVTIGDGIGRAAQLQPSFGRDQPATLTMLGSLTFKADGIYTCVLNTRRHTADEVVAAGVTIESGAQFVFRSRGLRSLRKGFVITAINNTAATPIAGEFTNLAEGAVISIGNANYQVSYHGGDGNDLTLTVVP